MRLRKCDIVGIAGLVVFFIGFYLVLYNHDFLLFQAWFLGLLSMCLLGQAIKFEILETQEKKEGHND